MTGEEAKTIYLAWCEGYAVKPELMRDAAQALFISDPLQAQPLATAAGMKLWRRAGRMSVTQWLADHPADGFEGPRRG